MDNLRILVDMDEVLVDFCGAAARLHGRELPDDFRGSWSLADVWQISQDEFWKPIHSAGEPFWLGLDTHPWADELLMHVQTFTDDWHIVSTPSTKLASRTGKINWLQRYFGEEFDQFILTHRKHLLANPNTVLIDDRESTVKRFISHGGIGIVFPSAGNSLHEHRHDPLEYVLHALNSI